MSYVFLLQSDLDGGKTLTRWAQLDRSLEADLHRISMVESVPELAPSPPSFPAPQLVQHPQQQHGAKSSLKDRIKEEVQMHFQVW